MLSQLTDPLSAGPDLLTNKLRGTGGTQDEIRKPNSVKIYQLPAEERPKGAGFTSHILNNTVT